MQPRSVVYSAQPPAKAIASAMALAGVPGSLPYSLTSVVTVSVTRIV